MTSPDGASPPITVSIVLHGQWALVRPLLEQLREHCSSVIDQVLLTVNVPERDIATQGWTFPVVRIDNPQPQGFGRNHNAAFTRCRTPWFLVLNPDIRLEGDVLTALLERATDRTGLLTPRIQEPTKASPEPFRGLLTPYELWARRQKRFVPPPLPAWVAGMFMLLRRDAFAQVQGFDERFFMYCEDFDLCARLRLAGWELHVVENLRVLHDARRASNSSLLPMRWHLTSFAKVWTSRAFWRYRRLLAE